MNPIDFTSDEGFMQAAGKKKKKQTTAFNWLEDEGDKKDPDGGDAEENKDQNGGDSGSGGDSGNTGGNGGDDGEKKDSDNKAPEEANADDIWGFTSVSSKKKNKAKIAETKANEDFGLPDIPSTDFHEIKLDDTGGGGGGGDGGDPLGDLGLGAKAEKITTGLSAWTSSWTTGSWGWGGMKSPTATSPNAVEEKPISPEPVVDDNPWSINRGKPKKKTTSTFNFGSFDEADEVKHESTIDFLGSSKPAEKKDLGGFAWGAPAAKPAEDDFWNNLGKPKTAEKTKVEEAPTPAQEPVDDIWGWGSAKKDVS